MDKTHLTLSKLSVIVDIIMHKLNNNLMSTNLALSDTETDHLAPPDSWNQKMFLARGGRRNKLKPEKQLK